MKKKNKYFSSCLVGHLLRQGKKNRISNKVYNVGSGLSKLKNLDIETFFFTVFNILRPYVEVRSVRVRRTSYLVPFPTSLKRQQHIISCWLLESMRGNIKAKSMEILLREELIKILLQKGALIEKKRELYRRAEKSRSFAHFRWY